MGELVELIVGRAGWGLGAAVVLGALAVVRRGPRQVLKEAVKAGLAVGDRVEEWTNRTRDDVEDLVAEAQSERRGRAAPSGEVPADAAPPAEP
jgi:hypothetical protein